MSIDTDIAFWLSAVFIVGGLYVLAKSADMFVDASSVVARRFGISPLIVGMLIIGFGTSAPELVVSAISAAADHPGLSLGNAYGSCIFNIAGILGVVALMKPITVKPSVNGFAVPLLLIITGLSMLLVRDGSFSRCNGIVLLVLFSVLLPLYCWFDQKMSKRKDADCCGEPGCDCLTKRPVWIEWMRILVGLLLLVSSSHLLVWGSVDFARDILGASDLLIGLTIVAIGTSLPELASAIVSVKKGENEFVIGNIVGSNFFNTLAVVGIAGTISPFEGFSRLIILRDLPVMFFLSLSIALFSIDFRHPLRAGCIGRRKGVFWVLLFVVYSVIMAMQELSAEPVRATPAAHRSKADAPLNSVRRIARCSLRGHPRVSLPPVGKGKVDTEYFAQTAIPFYQRHLVEAFSPAEGSKPEVNEKIRSVRNALARYFATGRDEFPLGEERALGGELWSGGCRDGAVGIMKYLSLNSDGRYWQGAKILKGVIKTHDFRKEPLLGFILRSYLCKAEHYRITRRQSNPEKPFKDACASLEKNVTTEVIDIFKKADPAILERLEWVTWIPESFAAQVGNEYLRHCIVADKAVSDAFDARGSGWARNVTAEGWNGFSHYNGIAVSNLLAAVRLRPDGAYAQMMLARVCGYSCLGRDVEGDAYSWCSKAISHSLDVSAEFIRRFVHFRTSRWCGSTAFLQDFLMDCATNVDVRSTFSYRAAAVAFNKILVAEAENTVQSDALERLITPDMRKALYAMFDTYAAAPESPFMPSSDVFLGMGMSLALQFDDWERVRRYHGMLSKPLRHYKDAQWLLRTAVPAVDNVRVGQLFEILGGSSHSDRFMAGEEAFAAGRYEEAFEIYRSLHDIKRPMESEKFLIGKRYFATRRKMEEKRGGWIDLMPTKSGGEAVHFWGMTYLDNDGKARCHRAKRSYYLVSSPIPAVGSEFEGTVHFEAKNRKQKEWNIGWGLGRLYSGFCAGNSSWSYPYIAFQRNELGDRFYIQAFTLENENRADDKLDGKLQKKADDIGWYPQIEVARGQLEKKDSHTFALKIINGNLSICIDGKEVFSYPMSKMLQVERMSDRIQPDGSVLPVWKVFSGTSFSGYRYRRILQ